MRYILALLLVIVSNNAAAQSVCDERAVILAYLEKDYKEMPVGRIGITSAGHVAEALVSRGGATWTILITTTAGVSCMIMVGTEGETIPPLSMRANQ